MEKEKLKIELFRYGRLVFGKVLEMDESLRGTGVLAENDEFIISSEGYPDLRCGELFVRGHEKVSDDNTFSYECESEKEAKEIVNYIKELVNEINNPIDVKTIDGKVIQIL